MNEYVIKDYNGKSIIDTNHSFERYEERNLLSKKEITDWLKRIIDYFNVHNYLEENDRVLVFSPTLNQGAVFHYRRDGKTNKLAYIMITFLSRGKEKPKKGTDKYIVEKYDEKSFAKNTYKFNSFSDTFIDFLTEVVEDIRTESKEDIKYLEGLDKEEKKKGIVNVFDSKIKNTDENITLILLDGKYYSYYDIVLEEID